MQNLRNITPSLTEIKTGTRGFKDGSGNYFLTAIGGDFIPAGQGGGGSTDFYKCATVTPASAGGILVSGAGTDVLNGVYTLEDPTATGENRVWRKSDQHYIYGSTDNGEWYIFDDSTTHNYYAGCDPSTTDPWDPSLTWYAMYASNPVPTVTQYQPSAAGWTGYKYRADIQSITDTATSLEYLSTIPPSVGKYYTSDGTAEVNPFTPAGVCFYAHLRSSQSSADTGQTLTENSVVFSESSAHFSGSSYIDFPADGLPVGAADRSVACWVKLSSTPSDDYAILFYGQQSSQYHAFNFAISSERKVKVDCWAHEVLGSSAIGIDTWAHVCATISDKQVSIYVNGVLDSTGSLSNMDTYQRATACIGARVYHENNLDGYMKACKVYNRALTAAEVSALSEEFTPTA